MDYMDKRASRMQGQLYFFEFKGSGQCSIFCRDLKTLDLFDGGCPEVPDHKPGTLSTCPSKFVGGGLASTFYDT